MIKINLLDSVTERQAGTAVVVERKIASPASRLLLMTIAVAFLVTAVIGWDIISTQMAKTQAEADLAEQKRIETELETVSKEMKELEAKIQNIDTRITAIKKLRDSQAGPSAVLEAMRERIAMVPGLYLESVEQTGRTVSHQKAIRLKKQRSRSSVAASNFRADFSRISISKRREKKNRINRK
jgi:Tfp pilus assembly protein PilN